MRKMFCAVLFFFIANYVHSGKTDVVAGQYQIPQTIYVGDRARLIYPLPQLLSISKDAKVTIEENDNDTESPQTDFDVVIRNVELDKSGKNLIIDFQAYRTGIVTLPVILIDKEKFSGIQVVVASLIDSGNSSMALSHPALPLAAEGTFWIITTIVLSITGAFLVIGFLWKRWGLFIIGLNTNLKSYYLLFVIFRIIKKTKKNLSKEKIEGLETITILSGELRKFFSLFWNIPCISMVPEEFLTIQIDNSKNYKSIQNDKISEVQTDLRIDLCSFFKTCDSLRFSGEGITVETANKIIEDAKNILRKVRKSIS
jgi:hypothetical protein